VILIVAALFFVIFSAGGVSMTPEEVKTSLSASNFGSPFLAII
jgi:hypothetical protein